MEGAVLTVEDIVEILRNPSAAANLKVDTNPNAWVGVKGYLGDTGKVKTQKVSGLISLDRGGYGHQVPWYAIIQHEDAVELAMKRVSRVPFWANTEESERKVFARPCPTVPRHGFVESRPIRTEEELRAVLVEAKAEDPDSEVLLMPVIDAEFSAIWTPTTLTLGPGNDGATSGNGAVQLPQTSDWMRQRKGQMLKDARITEDDDPYIEIVVQKGTHSARPFSDEPQGKVYLVQLRAGPKIGNYSDYVPLDMLVKRVIKTNGEDLLEWERKVKDFEAGDVVWHPGGSLASHYSVHCITQGIPVIITWEPRVGEVLKAKDKLEDYDLIQCVQGLMAGMSVRIGTKVKAEKNPATGDIVEKVTYRDLVGESNRIAHLCWATHNSGLMRGKSSYHIGYVSAIMHRFGTAACLGEARHATPNGHRPDRNQIYKTAFSNPFHARTKLQRALWLFQNYPWGGGYGGAPWAECTQSILDLDMAIIKMLNGHSKVEELVQALNRSVDKAHNHGWWLNKWAETSMFQRAAEGNPNVCWQSLPSIWEAENLRGQEVPTLISERVSKLEELGEYVPSEDVRHIVELRTRSAENKMKAQEQMAQAQWDHLTKPKSPAKVAQFKGTGPLGLSSHTIHVQFKTEKQIYGSREVKYFTYNFGQNHPNWQAMCPYCQQAIQYAGAHITAMYHDKSYSGSEQNYVLLHVDNGDICVSKNMLVQYALVNQLTPVPHENDKHGCKLISTFPVEKGFAFADGTPPNVMWVGGEMPTFNPMTGEKIEVPAEEKFVDIYDPEDTSAVEVKLVPDTVPADFAYVDHDDEDDYDSDWDEDNDEEDS